MRCRKGSAFAAITGIGLAVFSAKPISLTARPGFEFAPGNESIPELTIRVYGFAGLAAPVPMAGEVSA